MLILYFVLILALIVILYTLQFVNKTDPNRTEKKQELLKKLDTPKSEGTNKNKRRKQVNKVQLPQRKAVANTIGDIDPFEEAAAKKEPEKPATKTSKKQKKAAAKAAKTPAQQQQTKKTAQPAQPAQATSNKKKGKKGAQQAPSQPQVSYAEVAEKATVKEESNKKKNKRANASQQSPQKQSSQNEEELVANVHSDGMTAIAPAETISREELQGFTTVTAKRHKSPAAASFKHTSGTTAAVSDGWNIVGAPAEPKPTTSTIPSSNKRRTNNNTSSSNKPFKSSNLNYKPYATEADFWSSEPTPMVSETPATTELDTAADTNSTDEPPMPVNIDLLRNSLPSSQHSGAVIKMYKDAPPASVGHAWDSFDQNDYSNDGLLDAQEFPTMGEASTMPAPKKKRTQYAHQEPEQDMEIQEALEEDAIES